MMHGRCTGHCCRHFFLDYTIEDLQAMLDPSKDVRRCEDCEIIARMVIPAEVPDHLKGEKGCEPEYCFTCRHLLPNNDCLIYHARPKMCRNYPYGKNCKYPRCTYTGLGEEYESEENEQDCFECA